MICWHTHLTLLRVDEILQCDFNNFSYDFRLFSPIILLRHIIYQPQDCFTAIMNNSRLVACSNMHPSNPREIPNSLPEIIFSSPAKCSTTFMSRRQENCYQSLDLFTTRCKPPHDKTNKMAVRPAHTQIRLGIRPVWSESSQCAQWVAEDPMFLQADSEDSDQTGRMPRLIWVFAGRNGHFVGFIMRRPIFKLEGAY